MKKLIFIAFILLCYCEKDECDRTEISLNGMVYIDQPLGFQCGYPYSYNGAMHSDTTALSFTARVILLSDSIYYRRKSKIYKLQENEKLYLDDN